MAYSVRIKSIYLKNFIGISTGLHKKELEVSFKKLKDKNIILILGDNATGKSTFMSVLHCLPGTTDGRTKFIIEDKEGIKKVVYDRSDGCRFECKLIYSPSKTGHNTKGYVTKIYPDGSEEELNENGNITSYKDVVKDELGISDSILKLANQNDVCKGHVDMTSTERKVNMSTFLPDDIYSDYYTIVDKTYKELKTRLNIIVESLGKMHDEDTLKLELEKVTNLINKLVGRRDKCTAKISEYKTRISMIKQSQVTERNKALKDELKSCYSTTDKLRDKLEKIFIDNSLGSIITRDSTVQRIQAVLSELETQLKETEMSLSILSSEASELKTRRNNLTSSIDDKDLTLSELNTGKTLDELEKLRNELSNRLVRLDEYISKYGEFTSSKETLMIGYSIISNIRKIIDGFAPYDLGVVKHMCESEKDDYNTDASKLIEERNSAIKCRDSIIEKLKLISEQEDESENTLSKRPKECVIDSCPFIASDIRLRKLQSKIPEYTEQIDSLNAEIEDLDKDIRVCEEMKSVNTLMKTLWSYIESNMAIISKLPKNEKYSTKSAMKKAILKRGSNLHDCDDFEKYIELGEYREERDKLRDIDIPKIDHEIEMLKTKGKFISSIKEELDKLVKEKIEVINRLAEIDSKISKNKETKEYIEGLISALSNFYEYKSEYADTFKSIMDIDEKLASIKEQLAELDKCNEKLADKQCDLDEIDAELGPLTKQRDLYRMEQLKIADYKTEMSAVEKDMFICGIIRQSLSVKDNGIPISALEYFMDSVRQNANTLLSKAFNGNLYIEEFIINSKDFIIPYKKNGDKGIDVSYASSSERSFISLCLTLAIIEEIINSYTIVCLDEVDRGFATYAKSKFIEILASQIKRSGIQQLFMITHNASYYEGYDVGFILFPGADVNQIDTDDYILIEKG